MKEKVLENLKTDESPTPNYDAQSTDAQKVLKGCRLFITDLCYALKKDFYDELTYAEIQADANKRNDIAGRIINDFSFEERDDEGHWTIAMIRQYLATWVKDPDAVQRGLRAAMTRKERKYEEEMDEWMNDIGKKIQSKALSFAKTQPAAPVLEIEDVTPDRSRGRHKKTPIELYEDACSGIEGIWQALAGVKTFPNNTSDVVLEYIKPSRDHWLHIIKGLEHRESVHIYNLCVWTSQLIADRIKIWKESQSDNTVTA